MVCDRDHGARFGAQCGNFAKDFETDMDIAEIEARYARACNEYSDIHAHVATLSTYAAMCSSVREMGVRSGVSTWGFLHGLVSRARDDADASFELHGLDLSPAPAHYATLATAGVAGVPNLKCAFVQGNALDTRPIATDILFIDTFHVYGQLRRELSRFAPTTARFIIMHDTTVDEFAGEATRNGWSVAALAASTGMPESEIMMGLWPAVEEFLCVNGRRWRLRERFTHNNGLTVLERIAPEPHTFPISFAIDESKFAATRVADADADSDAENTEIKTKAFADIVPGRPYTFASETEYYAEYSCAFYAITGKKAGWDCMRHYEIIAAGCVPFFTDLDACPPETLTTLPKALIAEAMSLPGVDGAKATIDFAVFPKARYFALRDAICSHARKHCTTRALASYILDTVAPHVKSSDSAKQVLFLSGDARPDYLRCAVLAGLVQLLGIERVVDVVHVPHIYTSFGAEQVAALYGRGFSYTRTVAVTPAQEALRAAQRDAATVQRNIAARAYCLVVFGSVHRGMPFLSLVKQYYAKSEIVMLCGEDETELACVSAFGTHFKRECDLKPKPEPTP